MLTSDLSNQNSADGCNAAVAEVHGNPPTGQTAMAAASPPSGLQIESTPARALRNETQSERSCIYVCDDDPSLRRALHRLLESAGFEVRACADAATFLEAYDSSRVSCLVLDVRMPGVSGLELQEIIAQKCIDIPIVFITGHADVPMSVRAMKGGARDFIEKPFNEQVLLDAVWRAIHEDREHRSEREADRVAAARLARLTPRERDVMKLVVTGRSNKEVAAELGISEKTVKVHRGRVMTKMEADSLPDLVVLSQRANLDTPSA